MHRARIAANQESDYAGTSHHTAGWGQLGHPAVTCKLKRLVFGTSRFS